jgi:site-specific DNA recombinase
MGQRAVIYARRSQKHQDASVETQLQEAKRFVEEHGWTLVDLYPDDAEHTGRKEFKKRKQFLRLLADADEGKFDVVVVRDATRLGGDTARTMLAIETLKEAGVAVWYYIEKREVRLDNWLDKASFAIQSAASEGERDSISSRTFEALMVRARSGFNAGGACFGYRNRWVVEGNVKKRTEYEIDDKQASVVREIFQMYAEGEGLRGICKVLNQRGEPSPWAGKRGTRSWAPSVVRPMLRRERYHGVVVYGVTKKTYKGGTKVRIKRSPNEVMRVEKPELKIVPDDLWEAVQDRISKNNRKPWRQATGRKPRHLLSSLARCSECGGPIHARNGRMGKAATKVYMCGYFHDRASCKNSLRRPVEEADQGCIEWIGRNVLREEVVLEILREVRHRIGQHQAGAEGEAQRLEEQARRLRKEIGNLAEAVAVTGGSVQPLAEKLSERQERLTGIEARLKVLKVAPDVLSLEVRRLEARVRQRIDQFQELLARDPEEARKVVESLLEGPLSFTPEQRPEGMRYRVTGRIVTGALLEVPSGPQLERPYVDEFRTALVELAAAA